MSVHVHTHSCLLHVLGLAIYCKSCKDVAALVRAQGSSGTRGSEGGVMPNPQPGVLVYNFFPFCNLRDGEPLCLNFFPTRKIISLSPI